MKNKHIAMMKNLITATKYATREITKVEKRKQKQVSEKVTDALEFFMVKTDSETNSQKLYDMCCAIRPILSAIIKTNYHDGKILSELYHAGHIVSYATFCRLMHDQTDLMQEIMSRPISAKRLHTIIRVICEHKNELDSNPLVQLTWDTNYDDEQAIAIWTGIDNCRTAISKGKDLTNLITPSDSPSAIIGILTAADMLAEQDLDASTHMKFITARDKEGFKKYKYGEVITFIVEADIKYPINGSWADLIPCDAPRAVLQELTDNNKTWPKPEDKKQRQWLASKILEEWDGFTRHLEDYYTTNKDIICNRGNGSIREAWLKDLRDYYGIGDELANILINAKLKQEGTT